MGDKYKKNSINTNIIFSFDLDLGKNCISELFIEEGIDPSEFSDNFLMVIPIREIESWVLSDPDALEQWTKILKVNFSKCDKNFEISEKSTRSLLKIISTNKNFKDRLCNPKDIHKKSEYYNEELLDFIKKYFDPERARKNNNSLDRFLKKLENGFLS